jgi:hypothetical protein
MLWCAVFSLAAGALLQPLRGSKAHVAGSTEALTTQLEAATRWCGCWRVNTVLSTSQAVLACLRTHNTWVNCTLSILLTYHLCHEAAAH